MYNDISEILIKAARSASRATALELIKQANNQSYMTKSAVGAGAAAKVLLKKILPGVIATTGGATVLGGGGYAVKKWGEHDGRNQMRERYANEEARKKELEEARNAGRKAGREELATEQETQRRAAAERAAIADAARQAGIANASEMTLDQLAEFYAEHPEVQVPDSLRDLVNSRNQSGLSSILSNNKFMLGGGLAGAGIGYGLAGEDTKSKVLGALLGGSLGGGLGALVDNYVK